MTQGYDPSQFDPVPDLVVIGNAMVPWQPGGRVRPEQRLALLGRNGWLIDGTRPLGIGGRRHPWQDHHRQHAGLVPGACGHEPGFLIGGVPQNFSVSARLGDTPFFVIEADEYDSAFFDKRSKFVHYRPRTAILNNLEFDHRTSSPICRPSSSSSTALGAHDSKRRPGDPPDNRAGLAARDRQAWAAGRCKPPVPGGQWQVKLLSEDGSRFEVLFEGQAQGIVEWDMTGQHNVANALVTLAAARHVGVVPSMGIAALSAFKSVKRRMEKVADVNGITIYDDFAHHPTAIATTLDGLRKRLGMRRSSPLSSRAPTP